MGTRAIAPWNLRCGGTEVRREPQARSGQAEWIATPSDARRKALLSYWDGALTFGQLRKKVERTRAQKKR
jgi:hypothetical protein